MGFRKEEDTLGEKELAQDCYWGIHTQRALENFALSNSKVNPSLIKALALVKKAACLTNKELGYLEEGKAAAIISACEEIIAGKLQEQFPLDALQGGAGTSTNMNLNEVIANRALEIMGKRKGDYKVIHPLGDINLHQSTNDVYPTALKVAAIYLLRDLSKSTAALQGALQKKEKEFAEIVKIGRTELQEAVPITLGAEFSGFSEAIGRDRWRTFKCEERLRVVNLGATAVGTGIGAPQRYIFLVIEKLREVTGLGLARAENLIGETANSDSLVETSGILKAHASNLIKISNDLRLLNLLGEIKLEKLQAGSSIMPGKVNPVILEAVIQAANKVIANDLIIANCASQGNLQINEFLPLLAEAFLESLELLCKVDAMLEKHILEIKANPEKCREYFDKSPTIITALLPYIGYQESEELLKKFHNSGGQNLREFLKKELGEELINKVFSPQNLTSLGYRDDKNS